MGVAHAPVSPPRAESIPFPLRRGVSWKGRKGLNMASEAKIKVAVVVPKRDGFTGMHAGGVHFPNGFSVQEVPRERMGSVQRKHKLDLLKVVAIGEKDCVAAAERERTVTDVLAQAGYGDDRNAQIANMGGLKVPPLVTLPPLGTGPRANAATRAVVEVRKPREEPRAPQPIEAPTFLEHVESGATKGLSEEDAKAHYDLHLEALRAEAKRVGAQVIEPKS